MFSSKEGQGAFYVYSSHVVVWYYLYDLQQVSNPSLRLFALLLHVVTGTQKDQKRASYGLMKIFVSENLWILIRMPIKETGLHFIVCKSSSSFLCKFCWWLGNMYYIVHKIELWIYLRKTFENIWINLLFTFPLRILPMVRGR